MSSMDGTNHADDGSVTGVPAAAGVLDDVITFPAPDPPADSRADVDLAGLFRQHHAELVRLAVLMVRDLPTAEDVVQDVFTRIHARPHNRPKPAHELAYLRASVLNGCRSVYRRRAVAVRLGPSTEAPADTTPRPGGRSLRRTSPRRPRRSEPTRPAGCSWRWRRCLAGVARC
jgi:hypothetical protein